MMLTVLRPHRTGIMSPYRPLARGIKLKKIPQNVPIAFCCVCGDLSKQMPSTENPRLELYYPGWHCYDVLTHYTLMSSARMSAQSCTLCVRSSWLGRSRNRSAFDMCRVCVFPPCALSNASPQASPQPLSSPSPPPEESFRSRPGPPPASEVAHCRHSNSNGYSDAWPALFLFPPLSR